MKTLGRIHWLIVVLSSILLTACIRTRTDMPPIARPSRIRQPLIVGKQFRVVVLDFGTTVSEREESTAYLERALPAMILAALSKETYGPSDHKIPRFALYDGGIARRNEAVIEEQNASDVADAYLTGTIVARRADEVCFEARLANAINHQVLFVAPTATCAKLKPADAGGYPKIAEQAGLTLAVDIGKAIQKIGDGKILSADGKLVILNQGRDAHVLPGMPAYIVDASQSQNDDALDKWVSSYTTIPAGEVSERPPAVVGEIYVLSVEETYSIGLLFKGDYAVPGDTVYFK